MVTTVSRCCTVHGSVLTGKYCNTISPPIAITSNSCNVPRLPLIATLPSPMLRPCPTPGLIRLLRTHRSTVTQLRSSANHSGPGRAHILPLSATLCIRLNPVVTTLPRPPCCTVSSPCPVYIFYLVVFSPDLTYFRRT